ncbi:MAG: CPBP family glutamic-type intramembrane protease [Brevibacterium yomogidense]
MVFIVALAAWFGPSPGQFAVVLGWRNEVPVRGWAVAGAVAVGYTAYTLWAVPEIRPLVFERSWFRTIGVPLALLSGLIEEMFFRQVVMDWLAARGVTVLLQIVVSSLLFASAHAVWALFGKSWPATVPIRASTFGLGVLSRSSTWRRTESCCRQSLRTWPSTSSSSRDCCSVHRVGRRVPSGTPEASPIL